MDALAVYETTHKAEGAVCRHTVWREGEGTEKEFLGRTQQPTAAVQQAQIAKRLGPRRGEGGGTPQQDLGFLVTLVQLCHQQTQIAQRRRVAWVQRRRSPQQALRSSIRGLTLHLGGVIRSFGHVGVLHRPRQFESQ